jgi:hypothetical protein
MAFVGLSLLTLYMAGRIEIAFLNDCKNLRSFPYNPNQVITTTFSQTEFIEKNLVSKNKPKTIKVDCYAIDTTQLATP